MSQVTDTVSNHWHLCVVDTDYEISDEYPYPLRRVGSDRVVSESITDNGYVQCHMNDHRYLKHRVIATQFIDNPDPDNLTQVDHINHDRSDNHIENLRWCSRSDNNRNRSSVHGIEYEYVDQIPDDAIVVNDYGRHSFEFYYYSESTDEFYFYNGHRYRILHVNEVKQTGVLYVYMININNRRVKVTINKFKQLYGIEF